MSPIELSIPFTLGLVSSLHCTQMCGPLVLAYSLPLRGPALSRVTAHLAYNAGRICTYALLGAMAGLLGSVVGMAGHLAGIERTAAIVAGVAMLIAAFLVSGWAPAASLVKLGAPGRLSRMASKLLLTPLAASKFFLGLVLGFLPCGLIYAALLKAVEAGSAWDGALSMIAFGAGTAGALLGIGLFSSAIAAPLGRYANRLAAVSMLLLGLFLLWRGLTPVLFQKGCPLHGG